MIARVKDMSISMERELLVTFTLPLQAMNKVKALKEETLDLSVEKHREKRSLSANAYCWHLIGKMAEAVRTSKEEMYKMMLRRYGQGAVVSVMNSRLPAVQRELDCYEVVAEGQWETEMRLWIGSSKYDSREMSVFIDGIVDEAGDMGIETATPQEIERLKQAWERKYGPYKEKV